MDEPTYVEGIRKLLEIIHKEGARAFMHLNFPKERFLDRQVKGAKQKKDKWVQPIANNMTVEEAYTIVGKMANGACKAREIGYDGGRCSGKLRRPDCPASLSSFKQEDR